MIGRRGKLEIRIIPSYGYFPGEIHKPSELSIIAIIATDL